MHCRCGAAVSHGPDKDKKLKPAETTMPHADSTPHKRPLLREALAGSWRSLVGIIAFSGVVNTLMLAPIAYIVTVFAVALPAGSTQTLLMLSLLMVFLLLVAGSLVWVRAQLLSTLGTRIDKHLGSRAFDAVFDLARTSDGSVVNTRPLQDLGRLRAFLAGPHAATLCDIPWLPLHVAVMFWLDPLLGAIVLALALTMVAVAWFGAYRTQFDARRAHDIDVDSDDQVQHHLRHPLTIDALGMLRGLHDRWLPRRDRVINLETRAARNTRLFATVVDTLYSVGWTSLLGAGAWLVLRDEADTGIAIAAGLLAALLLSPLRQLVDTLVQFNEARAAYRRLAEVASLYPAHSPLPLPPPSGLVSFEQVTITPAEAPEPILRHVSLTVEPGSLVAVIGPSAAGKSVLLRAMLGLYPAHQGTIRIDGAVLAQWDRGLLGRHVGYLPQDIELLAGSVGENIARFGELDAGRIIAAARQADIHRLILKLPQGYGTPVTRDLLSAGERQRIGLARALYGDPCLVLLDEPNAHLDMQGDKALERALSGLRERGATVIIVTHRQNVLDNVDRVLVMANGRIIEDDTPSRIIALLSGTRSLDSGQARRPPLPPRR
jgi:ATP-binding cassette subfamily C protein EexD